MKHNLYFTVLSLCIFLSACAPTRRETYVRASKNSDTGSSYVVTPFQDEQDYQYQLRPNDIISIRVASSTASEFNFLSYQNEQQMGATTSNNPLLSGFEVEVDGTIFLPVIGKVEVAGLTLDEARSKIQSIVSELLESPTVEIKLLSFRVTVIGEVEKEGTLMVYYSKLSLLDAIAQAGGLTDFSDPETVKIIRNHNDSLEVAYVNILEEDFLTSPYYYLQPEDVVSVASVPSKNWLTYNIKYLQILVSGLGAFGIFYNIFQ